MIIPMKKVLILTLKSYENQTLNELRDLGVVHLNSQQLKTVDAKDRLEAINNLASLDRTIGVLELLKVTPKNSSNAGGKALFENAELLVSERDNLSQELELINKSIIDMQEWGDFDFAQLEDYQKQGLRLYLCHAPNDDKLKEFATTDSCHLIELNRGKSGINFVLVSTVKLDRAKLPLANINCEKSLNQLTKESADIEKKLREISIKIVDVAENLGLIKDYKDNLVEEIEFISTRDAMNLDGEISYIDGFVPETKMKELEAAAKSNAWGYLAQDAERSVDVPTLVEMPKFAKIITPLFDFLAISPGYNELDVSGAFVIFFSIFFGILIGDAGYGVIFMALGIGGFIKSTERGKKDLFKMVTMLSIFAILWGLATNNVFGKSINGLGLECLTNEKTKDANTQLICFILGLAQLSLGHFWKAILDFKWRNIGAQLGWVAIMVGNFILVSGLLPKSFEAPELMKYCYIVGVVLVAVCEVQWTDASSIFAFPFGLVNSFVDLLSYIRLFAVGLAGYYLAVSFNDMAGLVFEGGSIIGIIGGIIILLFGHILNIALAVLSVLVHGVRLNTLEFSSHVGLQWTGFKYKPFKKTVK